MGETNLDSLKLSGGLTATTGSFSGAVAAGALSAAALTASSVASSGAVSGTTGTFSGALTAASLDLTTPLPKADANESLKRLIASVSFNGTLTDGSTNKRLIPIFRACTLTKAWLACIVKMVGGTNTLTISKVNAGASVTLLSTANVDPVTVPAAINVAQALTLSATPADLNFVAGDNILVTLVCGTMTTDGQDYAVSLELELADA
jgi:hypothetical protein